MDEKQLWLDILAVEENKVPVDEILKKYTDKYAVGQLSITSYEILWRFDKYNRGKSYDWQIKPYNFITVGIGYNPDPETKEQVIPMLPYVNKKSRDFLAIPYMSFTDFRTGKVYTNEDGQLSTQSFWTPLSEIVKDYMGHEEAKSVCDKDTRGKLERKHVVIDQASIHHIGKETNKLDDAEVIGADPGNYTEYVYWKSNN